MVFGLRGYSTKTNKVHNELVVGHQRAAAAYYTAPLSGLPLVCSSTVVLYTQLHSRYIHTLTSEAKHTTTILLILLQLPGF